MYTVTNLITEAYSDSGVVSRQFETVQGYQLSDGLDWLNQILGDKAMNDGGIPYITVQYPFLGVPGQEFYFIPNLVDVQSITFYISSVRYQMRFVDRIRYFGNPRANNINALPVSFTWERQYGGVMIGVYFPPQFPFLFTVTGNFFLQSVNLNQDLQSTVSIANLGTPIVTGVGPGSFTLAPGQFVVNNVDLAGSYLNVAAFVTAFNSAKVPSTPQFAAISTNATQPYVQASIVGTQFILTNYGPLSQGSAAYILIQTNGQQNGVYNLTFQNFSTISSAALAQPFFCTSYDQFYIDYLEYSLAERICQKLNFEVPVGVATQSSRYSAMIDKMAEPLDVSQQKVSPLGNIRGLNYGQANLGKGYTVTGI